MKEILIRLFAHEELSHEEACNLMNLNSATLL